MIAFAALVITYFILLLAALAWLLASVQVARLKALDVRLVHATLGALLLGVMAALLLRSIGVAERQRSLGVP